MENYFDVAAAKLEVASHLGFLYEMNLGVGDAIVPVAGILKKLKTIDSFIATSKYDSENYINAVGKRDSH